MDNNIPGTVVVKEKRNIKDFLSERYHNQLEKLNNITPEQYDIQLAERKKAIQIAGKAATVALIACPADGPFGEMLSTVATPLFAEIVEGIGKMMKPIVFGLQKKLRGSLINSDSVTNYEFDQNEYDAATANLSQNISEFMGRAR